MTALPIKYGTLVGFGSNGYQSVVTDDGEAFWLSPQFDAAPGAKIGDRIKLEYRSTPSLGLWYASVVPPEAK